MKISEVTVEILADYLRLDDATEIEISEITRMRASAISYITNYTGLESSKLDDFEDLTQALFILVADMFDNRNLLIDGKKSINKSVECILGMHSVNLL